MNNGFCKVYIADVSPLADSELFDKCYSLLDEKRQNKVSAYKRESDRILSAGAGLLLRHAFLSCYPCEDFSSVTFKETAMGKPYIPERPGFGYNLSHSGKMVMCVASSLTAGCDIEAVSSARMKIMDRYFTPEEKAFVDNTPENEKADVFIRLWTLKESYIKATGTGLSVSLTSFSFDIKTDPVLKTTSPCTEPTYFHEFDQIEGYRASLCLLGHDIRPILTIPDLRELLLV